MLFGFLPLQKSQTDQKEYFRCRLTKEHSQEQPHVVPNLHWDNELMRKAE
jgi:hypothetical protein